MGIQYFAIEHAIFSEGSGRKGKVTSRSPQGTIGNALESLQNLSQALEAPGDTLRKTQSARATQLYSSGP